MEVNKILTYLLMNGEIGVSFQIFAKKADSIAS